MLCSKNLADKRFIIEATVVGMSSGLLKTGDPISHSISEATRLGLNSVMDISDVIATKSPEWRLGIMCELAGCLTLKVIMRPEDTSIIQIYKIVAQYLAKEWEIIEKRYLKMQEKA